MVDLFADMIVGASGVQLHSCASASTRATWLCIVALRRGVSVESSRCAPYSVTCQVLYDRYFRGPTTFNKSGAAWRSQNEDRIVNKKILNICARQCSGVTFLIHLLSFLVGEKCTSIQNTTGIQYICTGAHFSKFQNYPLILISNH